MGLAVPVGRLGPKLSVPVGVLLCVPGNSRAWRLYVFAPFTSDNDEGGRDAFRVSSAREFRGLLVGPVSLRLHFACCGRVRVYGACVGWNPEGRICRVPGGESGQGMQGCRF